MKLYNLTNLKTGRTYRNVSEEGVAALKKNSTGHAEGGSFLDRFSIEVISIPERRGESFIPPEIKEQASSAAAGAAADSIGSNAKTGPSTKAGKKPTPNAQNG